MNNNDKLVRIRYALDIKDTDMVKIFRMGGADISKEAMKEMFVRVPNEEDPDNPYPENLYKRMCNLAELEAFLNGFITFKRGERPLKPGEKKQEIPKTMTYQNINNEMLKKIKIALSMTSDDIIEVLDLSGVRISASELSALLRKESHPKYHPCGDKYARNFLKGLAIKYRDNK